jgi:hypothetical protein
MYRIEVAGASAKKKNRSVSRHMRIVGNTAMPLTGGRFST